MRSFCDSYRALLDCLETKVNRTVPATYVVGDARKKLRRADAKRHKDRPAGSRVAGKTKENLMATTTAAEPTSAYEDAGSPNGGEWRDPRYPLVLLAVTVAPIALVVDMFFSVIVALLNRLAWSIKQHCPRHRPAA